MRCGELETWLQRRLDAGPKELADFLEHHLEHCLDCRALHAAALRLEDGLRALAPPRVPADLTGHIVHRVMAARNSRFRRRLAAVAALAATVLALSLAVPPHGQTNRLGSPEASVALKDTVPPSEAPRQPPSLSRSVREAGSALVALVGRTADETMGESRVLLPATLPQRVLAPVSWPEPLDPPVQSMRQAGEGVSAGLEPVVSSARRAMDLFLRDAPETAPGGHQ
jgi:predicted anti-sigma-YlaC factor YlaD